MVTTMREPILSGVAVYVMLFIIMAIVAYVRR